MFIASISMKRSPKKLRRTLRRPLTTGERVFRGTSARGELDAVRPLGSRRQESKGKKKAAYALAVAKNWTTSGRQTGT
jgi:hypothetical protein